MFKNYLITALRAMAKNKLYAAINVIGLAVGLTVFLFAIILVDYEQNHDTFFKNHERIYTIGYRFGPSSNTGFKEMGATHSTMGPLLAAELEEIETSVRTLNSSYVVSIGNNHFHERIKFAEPDFPLIFDFNYIQGQANALEKPDGMMISETIAQKWFGRTDVVGETVLVNADHPMQITAVIQNVPVNSHFNSLILGIPPNVVAAYAALKPLINYDLNGNWNNLSSSDHTYLMTKTPLSDLAGFESKVNAVHSRHMPDGRDKDSIDSIRVRTLPEVNTTLFDMAGLPIITSVQLLGVLVLIIAVVNYTNLASVQSMSRTREVGLRKTMGASRVQLIIQFMVESFTTVLFAILLSLSLLEFILPGFNLITNKVVALNYLKAMPLLFGTTLLTTLLAGAYPSYLITRNSTLDALKDANNKGQRGSIFRSLMIGTQFMLSIFMLALVMIVFSQNHIVSEKANIFPKSQVLVLERIGTQAIYEKEEILHRELLAIEGVDAVAFTSIPPFEQSNSTTDISKNKGDENSKLRVNQLNVTNDFISVLDIPLIAGRNFELTDKRANSSVRYMNVILNELAARQLGFASPQAAVGESLWDSSIENFEYRIIGVIADRNYQGLHNRVKPFMHFMNNAAKSRAMVRINENAPANVVAQIEAAWTGVFPDYPLEHRYLDALFEDTYQVYRAMSGTLAGFALVAMLLALIGLFGLAAFMARGRTREIGVRKVMGASVAQIVRLLLWQFSKPVTWALVIAIPLAIPASNMYLNFFAERISYQIPLILLSGVAAILLSCGVIAVHAIRVAKASPIKALRYE